MISVKGIYFDLKIFLSFIERTIVPVILTWIGIKKRIGRPLLVRVSWLDENDSNCLQVFEDARVCLSYGPKINGVYSYENVTIPAVKLYRFREIECSGQSSSILKNKCLFLERVKDCNPVKCNYSSKHIRRVGVSFALVCRERVQGLEKGIFLGGNGSFNYYHWMMEILPKLQFIQMLGSEFDGYPLLVDQSIKDTPALMESLSFIAGTRKIILLKNEVMYKVEDFIYINAPTIAPFNLRGKEIFCLSYFLTRKDSVLFIREALLSMRRVEGDGKMLGERLFFARRGKRRKYNQDEIFNVFEQEGFVKVFLDEYTLQEQVELVSKAKMIAGPSGAAWTNIIFCQEGAKGLCWMNERLYGFCTFSNLAHCVDMDLRYVTYKSNIRETHEFYSSHYRVDVNKIKHELFLMLPKEMNNV